MKYLLAAFLAFIPGLLPAAELQSTDVMDILEDWSGGLNTTQEPHKLARNESPFLRNVLIDEKPGSIVKSNGYLLAGSTNTLSKITGMWAFEKSDGTKYLIISDSSRVLATTDFSNFSNIKTALNPAANLDARQVRDKMWFTNGSDPVFTWDGSTTVLLNGTTDGGVPTPNVPRGKYIDFYQARVFIYNDTTDNSALSFSAIIDTNGVIIAPDNQFAWIDPTFALSVSRGDGQVGTALWQKDGLLYAAKERSIYAIFGQDQFTYNAKPIDKEVGVVSNDSIAFGDDLVYFLGYDGIYKHTGTKAIRISDRIVPDFEAINRSSVRTGQNVWNTAQQFSAGTVAGSTITNAGFVRLPSTYAFINTMSPTPPSGTNYLELRCLNGCGDASTSTAFVPLLSTASMEGTQYALHSIQVALACTSDTVSGFSSCGAGLSFGPVEVQVKNLRTGATDVTSNFFTSGGLNVFQNWNFNFSDSLSFTNTDIAKSSFTVKFLNFGTFTNVLIYIATTPGFADINLYNSITTGAYTSEIATIPTITGWGTFDAAYNANGGTVAFYVKASTSLVNNSTEAWMAITPGSIIGSPVAKNYIQWTSTLITTRGQLPPEIDSVKINHIEGSGPSSRSVAIQWKNRYWLAVSTESTGNFTLLYIKSKIYNSNPDAWMVMDGINIRSMVRFNNNLYGGSATSGQFYRLDYGTNYNGSNFTAIYETPDLLLNETSGNRTFLEKIQAQYIVDAQKNGGGSMTVGTSSNSGDYTNISVDLSGSGRLFRSLYNLSTPYTGFWFRYRFSNSDLDKGWQMNKFGVIYTPTQVTP